MWYEDVCLRREICYRQTERTKGMDKISKKGATGQYWSILNNIKQCLTISGNSPFITFLLQDKKKTAIAKSAKTHSAA